MRRTCAACLALLCLSLGTAGAQAPVDFQKIKNIIVIYQENWSFDGLYGKFPGADNLADAGAAVKQVDLDGRPLTALPQVFMDPKQEVPDTRFPPSMPVGPYDLTRYAPVTSITGDLVHGFYEEQVQIDGGKMDKFVSGSNNGGLVMSYADATQLPEGKLAARYTLCDHYFHGAFGGSLLNHIFLVAAAPPVFADAPEALKTGVGPDGMPLKLKGKKGVVTPDGFAINDMESVNHPHKKGVPAEDLLPSQTMPTIGDRLSEKGVSWAWYAQGWDKALAGKPSKFFTFHHQPFVYFRNFADGTRAKKEHLKDENALLAALGGEGTLPQVSFVKFMASGNEHPHDSDLLRGQQRSADLVERILKSKYGKECAIVIIYDENGGRWDHVAPPKGDRWGPGTRVPLIVISRFAKRGFVDHTVYTTLSILKFIESRFGLKALNGRDAGAANLDNAFDFSKEL